MLLLILLPYLFLELYFSLSVGEDIGFLWSVIWIVTTFFIGMGLLKNTHITLMKNMQSVSLGKLNAQSFHDASLSYFVGAMLLIIPGVFSDFVGVMALLYTMFLQLGGTIPFIKNKNNIKKSNQQGETDVIDVEIIEYDTDRNIKP